MRHECISENNKKFYDLHWEISEKHELNLSSDPQLNYSFKNIEFKYKIVIIIIIIIIIIYVNKKNNLLDSLVLILLVLNFYS